MKLAIIVPYRDRAEHLAEFVPAIAAHLHDVMHHIYVIEQADAKPFNRGKLLNTGFRLVAEDTLMSRAIGYPVMDYSHVALHDVDMLPTEVRYTDVDRPTHLAGAASQFGHALPYPTYFGGVTLFPVSAFRKVNGFNNDYWGWGCEDDDLLDRCAHHHVPVDRVAGRFRSLPHTPVMSDPKLTTGYHANWERLKRNRAGENEYATNGLGSLAFTFKKWLPYSADTTILQVTL